MDAEVSLVVGLGRCALIATAFKLQQNGNDENENACTPGERKRMRQQVNDSSIQGEGIQVVIVPVFQKIFQNEKLRKQGLRHKERYASNWLGERGARGTWDAGRHIDCL